MVLLWDKDPLPRGDRAGFLCNYTQSRSQEGEVLYLAFILVSSNISSGTLNDI